ncbi:hypothetical protein KFU94_14765 [Chloroflexi bacterium TSY]|nr:hypothetical protein [Chloroflexi bacterium TSY]
MPLLFQTGYLTINSYDPETQQYTLHYPNYEVENAFLVYVLDAFSNLQQGLSETHLTLIGANFRSKTRKIDEWKQEKADVSPCTNL